MNQHPTTELIEQIGSLSPDGYLLYDLVQDAVVYSNHALATILELPDISQCHISDLSETVAEDRVFTYSCLHQLRKDRRLNNVEVRLRNSRIVSCDAYWLQERNLAIVIIKDITNSKQFTNYIVEFGARKDALLDMVAHNLSGPLNLTNSLLNVVDQVNQVQQYKTINAHTRLIRENTQKCIEVINSFLKEEHLTSPEIFVEKNRFDVVAKVRIVIEKIKPFNQDKEIVFLSNADEIFISSDDVKFFQSIHNLVSNAVKFTPPSGQILIEITDTEDRVIIDVADNGIGIPDHLQSHIFQRNTPASREGLKGEKSIGMGLYIVKKLIELMNGDITFESEENIGTTFTLSIPKVGQLSQQ